MAEPIVRKGIWHKCGEGDFRVVGIARAVEQPPETAELYGYARHIHGRGQITVYHRQNHGTFFFLKTDRISDDELVLYYSELPFSDGPLFARSPGDFSQEPEKDGYGTALPLFTLVNFEGEG